MFALYRTYLRQANDLPHVYLRHFFRIKGADDFRSVLGTKSVELRNKKLKRISKDLQRLRVANRGDSGAFDRMLDIAYGRVGKLRWELMEPLLSDTNAPLLSPINPRTEQTRSPSYSPELVALLTSGISRTTKSLQKHHLISPPGLRVRAKSDSQDTALGPPSWRREYNIRWRFFKKEWKKVYPPLQLSLQHPTNHTITHTFSHPPLNFGFQNAITLQDLLALAGSPSRSLEPTSKQRKQQRIQKISDANSFDGGLSVRWLRRRYQALLGRIPLLIHRPPLSQGGLKRTYDVRLANNALPTSRPHASRLRFVDIDDVSWISDINDMVGSGSHRE